MPELPEVETIKLGLKQYLVGHVIEKVDVKLQRIVQGNTEDIIHTRVVDVRRFGKGLVIDLQNGYSLGIHIKLTGQLIYVDKKNSTKPIKVIRNTFSTLPNKWTHVIFYLDKGAVLYYNDFRQFGWIKIIKTDELQKLVFFKELGPEFPLKNSTQTQNVLTFDDFQNIVKNSKTVIKPLLLDQKKISGLGNIYINDGLFLAKIDPRRKANTLTQEEIKTLFESLETVLGKGLTYGGASELSFVNALGEEGHYQDHMLVYGKAGSPCPTCGKPIDKIMLGGRGTYFCPNCQK